MAERMDNAVCRCCECDLKNVLHWQWSGFLGVIFENLIFSQQLKSLAFKKKRREYLELVWGRKMVDAREGYAYD